jgi:SAM-dependent methyltransferase
VRSEQRWLATQWPNVRSYLPEPPAVVVEVGCGSLGGFVPALLRGGYEALGIDPKAPEGACYRRVEFERTAVETQVDAIVACASLHHVTEPGVVLDRIAETLAPCGVVIVIEWDWERFDESTAEWCFERLGAPDRTGWLQRHRSGWIDSAQPWDRYLRTWATEHGIHTAQALLQELDRRLQRHVCRRGPYFFADLAETSEQDELDAIVAGQIQATRVDYVGGLS